MNTLFALSALVLCAAAGTGYFWVVTDVHYQMDYTIGGDPSNRCKGSGSTAKKFGDYDCNTPWVSVKAIVDKMILESNKTGVAPDFIFHGGDIMSPWESNFGEKSFTTHMINWTTQMKRVQSAFGGTPKVFTTLGNHDAAPKQHQFPDDSANFIYTENYKYWSTFLSDDAKASFKKGSYFSELVRPGLRFISINTGMYFTSNKQITVDKNADPLGQFAWLKTTLNDARNNGEMVMIGTHIAPGYSIGAGSAGMYAEWNEKLLETLNGFHDIIVGSFYGHYHADSLRIFKDTDGGSGYHIGFLHGSGTPHENLNPSVTLWKYQTEAPFTLLDKTVFYFDLSADNADGAITWSTLYQMTSEYNVTDCSRASMTDLISRLEKFDGPEWKAYVDNIFARGPEHADTAASHKARICCIKYAQFDEMKACLNA